MMRHASYCLLVALVALLMASCSSVRKAQRTPMIGGVRGTDYMERLIEDAPRWQCVTGKLSLNLRMGDGKNTRVGGSLRIKRGEVILLSVAPFLGIEVARIEITPEGVLVVDRLHKRYVQASFESVGSILGAETDFHMLQSLFLNELFLPGRRELESGDVNAFRLSVANDSQALMEAKKGKLLSYRFWTSTDRGVLEKTVVGVKGTGYALDWEYGDFGELEGKLFPRRILLSVEGAGKPLSAEMKLSRLSSNSDWESGTELSSKYRKVELQELLKMIKK